MIFTGVNRASHGPRCIRVPSAIRHLLAASPEDNLPRIAFKMATGSGKTVVMAALVAYHYFNRAEYRNDVRFADNFLFITPGITIKDRLGVLRVDTRPGVEAGDYYHVGLADNDTYESLE